MGLVSTQMGRRGGDRRDETPLPPFLPPSQREKALITFSGSSTVPQRRETKKRKRSKKQRKTKKRIQGRTFVGHIRRCSLSLCQGITNGIGSPVMFCFGQVFVYHMFEGARAQPHNIIKTFTFEPESRNVCITIVNISKKVASRKIHVINTH